MKNIIKISIFAFMLLGINTIINAQPDCDTITSVISIDSTKYAPPVDEPYFFSPPHPSSPPGDKAIYWIHGMNGNQSFWQGPAAWTDREYKVVSAIPNYGFAQTSWLNSWEELRDQINTDWSNTTYALTDLTSKSFAIAESFGGVVVRKVSEEVDPQPINGIVTFDTPHGGSNLAQYIEPGYDPSVTTPEFEDLAHTLAINASQLAAAPITEYLIFGNITYNGDVLSIEDIDWESMQLDFSGVTSKVENVISNNWANTAFSIVDWTLMPIPHIIEIVMHNQEEEIARAFIQNMTSEAVEVLSPGSTELNITEQITPDGDEYKRVAFYGDITEGHENAHYSAFKMLYSALSNPHLMGEFGAGNLNKEAEDIYDNIKQFYDDQEVLYEDYYDKKFLITPDSWPWKVFPYITWGQLDRLANLYDNGFDGFTQFNDYYETICDAREYVDNGESTLGTCVCEDYNGTPTSWQYNVPESDCQGGPCDWQPNDFGIVSTLLPYDGFLTAESMTDWNNAPKIPKIPLTGSNHVTVKNDNNTKLALQELFRGLHGKFFSTNKR